MTLRDGMQLPVWTWAYSNRVAVAAKRSIFGDVPLSVQPNTPMESQLMSSTVMSRMFGFVGAAFVPKTQARNNATKLSRMKMGFMNQRFGRSFTRNGFTSFGSTFFIKSFVYLRLARS